LWGSSQRSPDLLARFKSGGRDKGRTGEKTRGDRQLREGQKKEGRKGRKGRREWEGNGSRNLAGASKDTPATQNASHAEILGGGTRIRKLGETKFKFGQLILRKIIEIIATRCHMLRLKCTKFDFGWGSAPNPAGGSSQRSPDLLAGFMGSYF